MRNGRLFIRKVSLIIFFYINRSNYTYAKIPNSNCLTKSFSCRNAFDKNISHDTCDLNFLKNKKNSISTFSSKCTISNLDFSKNDKNDELYSLTKIITDYQCNARQNHNRQYSHNSTVRKTINHSNVNRTNRNNLVAVKRNVTQNNGNRGRVAHAPQKCITTDVLFNTYGNKVTLSQQCFERCVLKCNVPSVVRIADVKISLTNRARHKIRKEILKYFGSKRSLEKLLSLANLYLPVVDKIFKDNKFPLDLKYIMLLESGCVGNARSNSRDPAVGYWQFKSKTASWMGLKIDRNIDERMHIIASTNGFIRYINTCNKKWNNYALCIMAFYLGQQGCKDMVKKLHIKNCKNMTLDHNWHFYIYMFIAYKIVFSQFITHPSTVRLVGDRHCNGLTVSQICRKYKINSDVFHVLNRWLKVNKVPNDNKNLIIIPMKK